ncbi:PAS domain S-box protein, partial [Microcoleus sp. HI-ES]|nr:PAS domain S-box protein [Microcoleus sp. HI-ES]
TQSQTWFKKLQALMGVISKIRESLDLETIFKITATEVRQLLNADRVVVYRFLPESEWNEGEVVSEDVLPQYSPSLGTKIRDYCFGEQFAAKYTKGYVQAVTDIYKARLSPCHLKILKRFQIRANLVVPLLQGQHLWGLLCIHSCGQPRQWQEDEIEFARQVGDHLAVAIYQAELHLQTQRQIAEIESTQQKLRDSEQKYHQILDSIGDMVLVKGPKSKIVWANQAFRDYYGMTQEELQDIVDAPFADPDNTLQYVRDDAFVFDTGQTLQISEEPVTRYDGEVRLFSTVKTPIRNADGEIVMTVGVSRDMTERKAAEEAVKASESKYRSLVETSQDMIWSVDAIGRYTFVNPAVKYIYGYEPEEMIGRPFSDFVTPEQNQKDLEVFARLLAGESIFQYETTQIAKDGSMKHLMFNAIALYDETGNFLGTTGTAADITDRKQTEAALQQSEAKFRSLYELTSLPVFMLCDNAITDANTATLKLFGCTAAQQLYGQNPGKLSPPFQPNGKDSLSLVNEIMDIAFERGNHRFDWVHRRLDGTDFPAEVVLTIIEVGNEKIIQAVLQDLTDRKLAEETLVRSEHALRQQAQRELLLNQIANQIRTSLDLDTILATAVQEIRNLMHLDWCIFTWYRPNNNPPVWDVTFEAKNADLPSILGTYLIDDKSCFPVRQILRREILRIDDVSTFEDVEFRALFQSSKFNSVLSLPIHTAAGDIGVITCYQAMSVRNWSDSEVELMQAVVAQIAIAIDHAELYTQTRTAARLAQSQTQQLEETLRELQRTQTQLIQSEKMSSLG